MKRTAIYIWKSNPMRECIECEILFIYRLSFWAQESDDRVFLLRIFCSQRILYSFAEIECVVHHISSRALHSLHWLPKHQCHSIGIAGHRIKCWAYQSSDQSHSNPCIAFIRGSRHCIRLVKQTIYWYIFWLWAIL